MPRTYTLTYDVVTPESAEEGDFADTGFGHSPDDGTSTREGDCISEDPEVRRAALEAARAAATDTIEPDPDELADDFAGDVSACAVAMIVRLLTRHYGATEPSCAPTWAPGTWYTTPDGSTDYTTGAVTRVSVHLDGWTEAEERAVYDAVSAYRRRVCGW